MQASVAHKVAALPVAAAAATQYALRLLFA
jgi:hypothetical protein